MSLDRLHVFEGEPYRVRAALHRLLSASGGRARRFDRGESDAPALQAMVSACTGVSFGLPTIVVVERPTADQGKALLDALSKDRARCAGIALTFEGDYADGRAGWAKEAAKAGRVATFDFVQEGDRAALMRYLMEWKRGTGARLTAQGAEWLSRNVPVLTASVRGDKGKRDAQVYDIALMFSELRKIHSWAREEREIGVAELEEHASFAKTFDVWRFVDAACASDASQLAEQARRMAEQVGAQPFGPMRVLQGQLALAESVCGMLARGVHDPFEIQSRLDQARFNDRFWHEGDAPEERPAPINPFRIKKCVDFCRGKAPGHFAARLLAVDAAQVDLRRGLPGDLVVDRLVLALSGEGGYEEPFARGGAA